MPKFDVSITISVVIAICAIVSPIFTTLLNNHHLYKMKKLDLELETQKQSYFYKRGIYESYLKTAGKCIAYGLPELISNYGEIYPLALIYFPDSFHADLVNMNKLITNRDWKEAQKTLAQLAPKIRTTLNNM